MKLNNAELNAALVAHRLLLVALVRSFPGMPAAVEALAGDVDALTLSLPMSEQQRHTLHAELQCIGKEATAGQAKRNPPASG